MFDCVFDHAGEAFIRVLRIAIEERARLKNSHVCTEHLLLALTRDSHNIAAQALASMKIGSEHAEREVSKLLDKKQASEPLPAQYGFGFRVTEPEFITEANPPFSEMALCAVARAQDYACFLGNDKVQPEHLLLGLTETPNAGALKVLEELSVNLTFLRRELMHLIARDYWRAEKEPISVRTAIVTGLRQLIDRHERGADSLAALSERSGVCFTQLPGRQDIVHMVCLGYMADLLYTQVAFQRNLLEETLELLGRHTGTLDEELSASIVSSAAQNLRLEIRKTIEYVWSHEYRLLNQILDDAEHDLIGSLIEDLWWTQSEEIALNELFAEAMDDHRRTQLLSLQKRRIEIGQRLSKLRSRLEETIRQCFTRRSISA
jgi:hypothetical protein